MKTVKSWLEKLPSPYKEQALANYDGKTRVARDAEWALLFAFKWSSSPEGDDYWNKFYETLKSLCL